MTLPLPAMNLREHQTQLDADGVMVGVSRQALDETLELLDSLLSAAKSSEAAMAYVEQWQTLGSEEMADLQVRHERLRFAIAKATGERRPGPASAQGNSGRESRMNSPDHAALAQRLSEAARWLAQDIPDGTAEIQHLEGDVRLDELDLYCVRLMDAAAVALGLSAPDVRSEATITATDNAPGMSPK